MIESTNKFWETVYHRNICKLIGICYRYTADKSLAEDLAHDAFLKAIDKSASYEGKGYFDAWLRKIAVNHALQYLRDEKKKKHADDWLQQESDIAASEDDRDSIISYAYADYSEAELLEVINALPEHHRLVFHLYVIDSFTHVQIGEMLGISAGTSKSHLARARKKIKELLALKGNKKKDRKGILILFISGRWWSEDALFKKRLTDFEIAPEKTSSLNFSEVPTPSIIKPPIAASWNYAMVAVAVGVVITVVLMVYHSDSSSHRPDQAEVAPSAGNNDKAAQIDDYKKNSSNTDSATATLLPNRIIPVETIKTKRMKNLDSLGLVLLLSSGVVLDSAAQANNKTDVTVNNETQQVAVKTQAAEPDAVDVKSENEDGTFYASSLFWSGADHALYLKGTVSVDVGNNHFSGEGSFNFLDPVHLVIVNNNPITPGSTTKLTKKQYRLTQLSHEEATKKYGEQGRQGAVEITVME